MPGVGTVSGNSKSNWTTDPAVDSESWEGGPDSKLSEFSLQIMSLFFCKSAFFSGVTFFSDRGAKLAEEVPGGEQTGDDTTGTGA